MKERRNAYRRELLRSPWAIGALVLGSAYFVLESTLSGSWRPAAIGPALTALAILAVTTWIARRRAATDFFSELAPKLGLTYSPQGSYVPMTPLLSAGDRRSFSHVMEGPLYGKLGGPYSMVSHYTYHTGELESSEGNVPALAPHQFTICAIDVGSPLWRYRGLYLRPRLSGLGLDHDWLRVPKRHPVELESARFNDVYDLRRGSDQDEFAVRELFSPSFVVWLTEHPLRLGFECKGGTLVVFVRGHEGSEGKLILLHEAAREIARRIERQVEEGGSSGPARPAEAASRW